jgi:hypothetical protein
MEISMTYVFDVIACEAKRSVNGINRSPRSFQSFAMTTGLILLLTGSSLADPDAAHAPAPSANPAAAQVKPAKDGELSAEIVGTRKNNMIIGKIDPPAAFNLEDIQNFPEERLYPVLNNPITFEEGRDFSNMMESQDEKIIHPWLPEIPRAPFLSMMPVLDKPAKDWTFSVIDQGGAPVASQEGKGSPPSRFTWSGEDKDRGYLAVDTVYIPQLSTTDKEGYRHTYMGQPAQFAVLYYKDKGRTVVELSTKRLFVDKKTDLTKEASVFLDKVCDLIREDSRVPFGLQGYDTDSDLARAREQALQKYFSDKLLVPDTQISLLEPASPDKRGQAIAVVFNGTPGGSQ